MDVVSDGVSDTLLVLVVFLKSASVGETRRVQHGDLHTIHTFEGVDFGSIGSTVRLATAEFVCYVVGLQIISVRGVTS